MTECGSIPRERATSLRLPSWEEEQNKLGELSSWLECVRGHWGFELWDVVQKQDQMQCMYLEYLRTHGTLAKIGHNLVQTVLRIEQEEKGLSQPRSGTQIAHEVTVIFKNALS